MTTKTLLAASLVLNAGSLGTVTYLLKQDLGDARTPAPIIYCIAPNRSAAAETPPASTGSAVNSTQSSDRQRPFEGNTR